ncbi:MAG: glycerophosphodiester phosphodiesterase [Nitrospirales bacterium]|nr:glycerophosphodiester phosphodiesterase [Nitrospirales bacterium]
MDRSIKALIALGMTFLFLIGSFSITDVQSDTSQGNSNKPNPENSQPIIIAHRGASGYLPEHTLAAFSIAILHGADFIEPDVVMTKDRHLIVRHDNVLNLTTDVADHPELWSRRRTKTVDGEAITGWFSEDFTLAEIKTLRAIERFPQVRPENAKFNGQFEIPTLQEVINLVKTMEEFSGHAIGLYPEIKHPTYFDYLHLSMEEPLLQLLRENGYETKEARVYIQSFEVSNLKDLNTKTTIPLIQLLGSKGQPYDVQQAGGSLTYAQMATTKGLAEIATYADGVGPEKYHFLIPKDHDDNLSLSRATKFVQQAHALGLKVHPYTFRAENFFLPANFKEGHDPLSLGNSADEMEIFLQAGVDGFFTDHPNIGVQARDKFLDKHHGVGKRTKPKRIR